MLLVSLRVCFPQQGIRVSCGCVRTETPGINKAWWALLAHHPSGCEATTIMAFNASTGGRTPRVGGQGPQFLSGPRPG
jgi:hypothetical protein